ncbi:uncharacterized protein BJ212DRAFT_1276699 [Suillus subaureus]|uniref:CxC6 like cysteine cluster associated with KDZ domain-containing protein n=1 Tax=Suillus subaureus TaxID=48587 RepID=A0A9P7E6M0_9AGAM|nr:uncharacterized protein BJ212DRAFT_1276699 [Suillus subaureus]KAG1812534.1 hypothetical protein BJ212DRAFT_1276699 [Suillus subaureus]
MVGSEIWICRYDILPEPHNSSVLHLLFTMVHWHRLTKLQMHSDWTLEIMDCVTLAVGQQFCDFKATVCLAYNLQELHQEVEAHAQCKAKQAAKQVGGKKGKHSSSMLEQGEVVESQTSPAVKCKKEFNFQTYKFHALGDYVSTICQYGMSNSYSSEPTDCKSFEKQLTQIKCRQAHICRISDKIVHCPHIEIAELARNPHIHHHIGATEKSPVHIGLYLISHKGDPAIKNFLVKLKDHLLEQIAVPGVGEENDTNKVIIKDNRMYCHNIARFNYTNYDVRRAQDVINPRTSHCNVMVLCAANDVGHQGHKFVYGNMLGVYHVNVIYIGSGMVNYTPLQMEFLWVCWYEPMAQVSAWETLTLNQVRFLLMADQYLFNFLDPANVLRGCHIIPCFEKDKRHPEGSGMSACAGDKDDWHAYFINQWVRGIICV